MKIEVHLKEESYVRDKYEVEVSTSDLSSSSPFQDGTEMGLDELLDNFERFKAQLVQNSESELTSIKAMILGEQLEPVTPTSHESLLENEETATNKRVWSPGTTAQENQATFKDRDEPTDPVRVMVETHNNFEPIGKTEGRTATDNDKTRKPMLDVEAFSEFTVEAYLPFHVIREITMSASYAPDLTVTKLSTILLMDKVVLFLRRNYRPAAAYSIRVSE